jgi:hypothetical protein
MVAVVTAVLVAWTGGPAGAGPGGWGRAAPAPPYPDVAPVPPPGYPPPALYYPPPPPPLSTGAKIVYAPFYAAGLTLRYGVYYLLVAPLDVFARALDFGPAGGVERPPARRRWREAVPERDPGGVR